MGSLFTVFRTNISTEAQAPTRSDQKEKGTLPMGAGGVPHKAACLRLSFYVVLAPPGGGAWTA